MTKRLTEATTETAAVAALVDNAAARPMVMTVAGVPVLVMPEGWGVEDENFESKLAEPLRSRGMVGLATVDTLARYIGLRDTGRTQIFALRNRCEFRAIFNPDTKEGAGWADDGATLKLEVDYCLRQWKQHNGQWLSQEKFGEFLRERGVDIIDPDDGSILDLAENLEVHTTVKGKFARRGRDGSSTILWDEDVKAQTNVPATFTLKLPCFLLSETMFEVICRLNFRARDGVLHWQFLIDDFDVAMDAAWEAEVEKLRNHAALPVEVKERIFAGV